jgi:hypothetical protein
MLILYNEERLEVADKFNAGHIMPTECCIIATGMRVRFLKMKNTNAGLHRFHQLANSPAIAGHRGYEPEMHSIYLFLLLINSSGSRSN